MVNGVCGRRLLATGGKRLVLVPVSRPIGRQAGLIATVLVRLLGIFAVAASATFFPARKAWSEL